jgi:hypothetical protein
MPKKTLVPTHAALLPDDLVTTPSMALRNGGQQTRSFSRAGGCCQVGHLGGLVHVGQPLVEGESDGALAERVVPRAAVDHAARQARRRPAWRRMTSATSWRATSCSLTLDRCEAETSMANARSWSPAPWAMRIPLA